MFPPSVGRGPSRARAGDGHRAGGRVGEPPPDVRPLDVVDLLGRHEVDLDIESIAGYLTGRRVMVTGAGGSIGSELCRQVFRFAPRELVMVDRDESALYEVRLSMDGGAPLDQGGLVVADLRDPRTHPRGVR